MYPIPAAIPSDDAKTCDLLLARRAQAGEAGAFEALVQRYRDRVLKLSLRYTRNRADAEDAVQNTFLKAYWGLEHFRGDAAFYSWLHRIAVNSAKTIRSLRQRDEHVFCSWPADVDAADAPAHARDLDSPEDLARTEEICEAVNRAIATLRSEQRLAIVLRELQGLSYAQMASAMSCPLGTVRSRVFRAREAIDSQLREVFEDGLGRARRDSAWH